MSPAVRALGRHEFTVETEAPVAATPPLRRVWCAGALAVCECLAFDRTGTCLHVQTAQRFLLGEVLHG